MPETRPADVISFCFSSLLLTHSSGLIYETMSPLHQEYHAKTKIPSVSSKPTIVTRFTDPLLFEPGTHWHYGCGIDWAGLAVERLTKLSLEDYMREHIWNPLDIDDITFWPDKNPSIKARIAPLTVRDPSMPDGKGKVIHYSGPDLFAGITDCMGGQGAFASMPSYLKILHSILADNEKLLTKKTSAMMFQPQLTPQSQEAIQEKFSKDRTALHIGEFPETGLYDWGLGGVLMMNDTDEEWGAWRRNRCLIWR
jgi:CubicO group peptidase (beta-lactamase class C family)